MSAQPAPNCSLYRSQSWHLDLNKFYATLSADFSKIVDWRDPVGCIFGNYDYASLCTVRPYIQTLPSPPSCDSWPQFPQSLPSAALQILSFAHRVLPVTACPVTGISRPTSPSSTSSVPRHPLSHTLPTVSGPNSVSSHPPECSLDGLSAGPTWATVSLRGPPCSTRSRSPSPGCSPCSWASSTR